MGKSGHLQAKIYAVNDVAGVTFTFGCKNYKEAALMAEHLERVVQTALQVAAHEHGLVLDDDELGVMDLHEIFSKIAKEWFQSE